MNLLVGAPEKRLKTPTRLERLHQRLSDPILTLLTLMLSFLLFLIGPMQAAGVVTGQHFGYFFGLAFLPAAFMYSRSLLVAAPIGINARGNACPRPEPSRVS